MNNKSLSAKVCQLCLLALIAGGCATVPEPAEQQSQAAVSEEAQLATALPSPSATLKPSDTPQPTNTPTTTPTITLTPTFTLTPTPKPTPFGGGSGDISMMVSINVVRVSLEDKGDFDIVVPYDKIVAMLEINQMSTMRTDLSRRMGIWSPSGTAPRSTVIRSVEYSTCSAPISKRKLPSKCLVYRISLAGRRIKAACSIIWGPQWPMITTC